MSTETELGDHEQTEVEVVDENNNPQPAGEVEALATYSEETANYSIRIIPIVRSASTEFQAVFYTSAQGPVFRTVDPITDQESEALGISRRIQQDVNDALKYANANLELPPELADQPRASRSLNELVSKARN